MRSVVWKRHTPVCLDPDKLGRIFLFHANESIPPTTYVLVEVEPRQSGETVDETKAVAPSSLLLFTESGTHYRLVDLRRGRNDNLKGKTVLNLFQADESTCSHTNDKHKLLVMTILQSDRPF